MVNSFRYISFVIIVISLFPYNSGYAQSFINCGEEGSETIDCVVRVLGGGSVDYRINSLRKYQEGVEYDSWTRLVIRFEDDPGDPPTGKNWRLEFKALTLDLVGDGGNSLGLDFLTLEVVQIDGNIGAGVNHGEQTLEDGYKPLISNAAQGEFVLYITYKIGKGPVNTLLGENPGYYITDIRFMLSAE